MAIGNAMSTVGSSGSGPRTDELRDQVDPETARQAPRACVTRTPRCAGHSCTRVIEHRVSEERKVGPKLGDREFTPLGEGQLTEQCKLDATLVNCVARARRQQAPATHRTAHPYLRTRRGLGNTAGSYIPKATALG